MILVFYYFVYDLQLSLNFATTLLVIAKVTIKTEIDMELAPNVHRGKGRRRKVI